MATNEQHPWGRVDETGTVYVRVGADERAVGQFPDGSPEEALAYFERKYTDLAGQVALLEQRAKRGAPASDVAKAVATLRGTIDDAAAVGDLAALTTRLDALGTKVDELTQQQSVELQQAIDQAIVERTAIVEEAEKLAAAEPATVRWKQVSATLDELFARWQKHQQDGPRLPKATANDLWRRFRQARTTLEHERKAFFAELDAQHKDVKTRKQELIKQAEALVPLGSDGVARYRSLVDEWKKSGRAGKRNDDALWARFKAAGDAIFAAKGEEDARHQAEYEANLTLKQQLLDEAEPLLKATDRASAKASLASIQQRWDDIGRVPREHVRAIEERLRRVEQAVRKLDEDAWNKHDPEKKARSEGLASQLEEAIAKLEAEVAEAVGSGDDARIAAAREALDARRAWLDALG